MDLTINAQHQLLGLGHFLGMADEHLGRVLRIFVADESLRDKGIYLEFETPNGQITTTPQLTITDGIIEYPLPSNLMQEGELKVQLVVRDRDGLVWKSNVRHFCVAPSLNASEVVEESHPDFISQIQEALESFSANNEQLEGYASAEAERVANESSRVQADQSRAIAESTRNANELTRITNEQTRNSQESQRVEAEQSRVDAEASRVEAEQARVTAENLRQSVYDNLDTRLSILEAATQGNLYQTTDNSGVATGIMLPANSLPYVRMKRVGGSHTLVNGSLSPTPVTSIRSITAKGDEIVEIKIPDTIVAMNGYGWGLNEEVYNYIDFENQTFVVNCMWRYYPPGDENLANTVTDKIKTLYLCSQPVVVDISEHLGDFPYVKVAEQGILTFLNAQATSVPYSLVYHLKVS